MTLLVLLPTATRAGIVAPDFVGLHCARGRGKNGSAPVLASAGALPACSPIYTIAFSLAAGPGNIIHIGAKVARRFAFGRGLLDLDGDVAAQELEQVIHNVMLDGKLQIREHAESFTSELDQRVALRYRAEMDTVS